MLLAMMLVSMGVVSAVSARATHVMPEPVGIDVSDDELREMIKKGIKWKKSHILS